MRVKDAGSRSFSWYRACSGFRRSQLDTKALVRAANTQIGPITLSPGQASPRNACCHRVMVSPGTVGPCRRGWLRSNTGDRAAGSRRAPAAVVSPGARSGTTRVRGCGRPRPSAGPTRHGPAGRRGGSCSGRRGGRSGRCCADLGIIKIRASGGLDPASFGVGGAFARVPVRLRGQPCPPGPGQHAWRPASA